MPQMGVSVSEGTITKWLKQEGEEIQADEPLLEISTDKVDTEVPSPGTGVVQQILVQEGETVDVGTRLAVIGARRGSGRVQRRRGAAAEAAPPRRRPPRQLAESEAAASAGLPPAGAPGGACRTTHTGTGTRTAEPGANGDGKSFVSPVVARIASEHGVDVSQVPGTGRGGRVTKKDILGFVESGGQAAQPAARQLHLQPEAAAPAAPPRRPRSPPTAGGSRSRAASPAATAAGTCASTGCRRAVRGARGRRERGADDRDAQGHRRAHAPLARHVGPRHERSRGRPVARRGHRNSSSRAPEELRRQPDYLIFVARAVTETLREYPWISGEIRGDKIVTRETSSTSASPSSSPTGRA